MKSRVRQLFVVVALMFVLSLPAIANTIMFDGPSGTNYGGVYTGLYSGKLDGVITQFICDDPHDSISDGQSWSAVVFPLSTVGIAGNGVFSGPPAPYLATADGNIGYTPQEVYNSVGWLAYQLFSGASTDANGISFAIWGLTSGPVLPWTGPPSARGWMAVALTHDGYTNPNIWFAVPRAGLGVPGQEFVYVTSTPEPSTLILLGVGTLLLGVYAGKRKLSV